MKPDSEIHDRVEFVLGKFAPLQWDEILTAEQEAADAVEMIMEKGFEPAMSRYNRRKSAE